MTRLDALIALRDKVMSGDAKTTQDIWDAFSIDGGMTHHALGVFPAYNGSLDAAKALHDAVLPGWTVNNLHQLRKPDNGMPTTGVWSCLLFRYGPQILHVETKAETPARAWLLAILEALIWQEQAP